MDKFFDTIRGLGLAAKLNVDVAYVRIAYLLLSLLPGPAFVVYLAAWLLLPDQRNAIVLESFLSKRSSRP